MMSDTSKKTPKTTAPDEDRFVATGKSVTVIKRPKPQPKTTKRG